MTPTSMASGTDQSTVNWPGQSRPLSVVELQQALRSARLTQSMELAHELDDGIDETGDPVESAEFSEEFVDDDLEDMGFKSGAPVPPQNGESTARPRHGRGRGLRLGKRVLGLGRGRDGRPVGGGDADWLDEFDRPIVTPGPVPASPLLPERTSDLRISDAPRGFVAVFWRWVARVAVAVFLVAGVNQVFVRPFHTAAPVAAPTGIDVVAAAQVAARFTADYLTYKPATSASSARPGALSTTGWSGTARLGVDLVQPGATVLVDPRHVLVSVAARMQFAPAAGVSSAMATSASATRTSATIPVSPLLDQQVQRWVTLVVPVVGDGDDLQVTPLGPVFSGEPPAGVTTDAESQPAAAATAVTEPVVSTFLASYARSDVSYLASPGVTLTGLNNTVRFVSLNGWSLSTPATRTGNDAPTSGVGSGTVLWQLAGTDLQIAQSYSIALTSAQGRWYASAVGPNLTNLDG